MHTFIHDRSYEIYSFDLWFLFELLELDKYDLFTLTPEIAKTYLQVILSKMTFVILSKVKSIVKYWFS